MRRLSEAVHGAAGRQALAQASSRSMSSSILPWAWVPIVLWAALAQTARNAAQRSLVAQAGTWGATLARFLYGLPFAAAWVGVLHALGGTAHAVPAFHAGTSAG